LPGALAQGTLVEAGRIAYLRECSGCHGESGNGDGPDAPYLASAPTDLRRSSVLETYREDDLRARIREGQMLALELRPLELARHAHETAALYNYLTRLPGVDWEKVTAGEQLYLARCLPCHDRYGHPSDQLLPGVRKPPRDLADPAFQKAVSDKDLRVLARHGKAAMPALVPRLQEEEVPPLVAFIRRLSPGYETYDRFCQRCHGVEGRGAEEPFAELGAPRFVFDSRYFSTHDKEQVQAAIWHMLRDNKPQMPHFAGSLEESDLRAILAYLRSLPRDSTVVPTRPRDS